MAKKTTSHLRGLLSSSVKKACFVLLLIASGVLSMAQSPQYFNLDNGTSSNSFPFNMALGKEVCWLFLAGEFSQPLPIPAGNMITNVYFRISSSGTKDFSNLIILMAQDTISSLTGGTFYSGPMDTVYYNPLATLTGTSGSWMQITLDNPFPYDPSKSLILMVGHCGATGAGLTIYQSGVPGGNRRVWSVAGCPFVAYTSADISSLNFGVDVEPFINIAGVDSVDVLCNGSENGSITITASGGLGPLQYSIDNGATWQSNNAFPGLSPGIYNVIVNDSVGTLTPYAYNPITISEPSAVVISQVNSVNVSCYGENDGSISISATGGTGTLQYSIDGSYSFHSDSIFFAMTLCF